MRANHGGHVVGLHQKYSQLPERWRLANDMAPRMTIPLLVAQCTLGSRTKWPALRTHETTVSCLHHNKDMEIRGIQVQRETLGPKQDKHSQCNVRKSDTRTMTVNDTPFLPFMLRSALFHELGPADTSAPSEGVIQSTGCAQCYYAPMKGGRRCCIPSSCDA